MSLDKVAVVEKWLDGPDQGYKPQVWMRSFHSFPFPLSSITHSHHHHYINQLPPILPLYNSSYQPLYKMTQLFGQRFERPTCGRTFTYPGASVDKNKVSQSSSSPSDRWAGTDHHLLSHSVLNRNHFQLKAQPYQASLSLEQLQVDQEGKAIQGMFV